MAKKALNAKVLEHLKPEPGRRLELWDRKLPGFGLRITERDTRTWFVMYRVGAGDNRRQRRMTIGDAKGMSLGKARELAEKALRKVDRGIDPAAAAEDESEPDETAGTVRAVAEVVSSRFGSTSPSDELGSGTKRRSMTAALTSDGRLAEVSGCWALRVLSVR